MKQKIWSKAEKGQRDFSCFLLFLPHQAQPVPGSEIVGPAQLRTREFRVPFTFASSPLSEGLEQATPGSITPPLSLLRENRDSGRGGGGTLEISGWGFAAGTLEPLTYTRASSAEFCYPILE